jgi:hypothetical protein
MTTQAHEMSVRSSTASPWPTPSCTRRSTQHEAIEWERASRTPLRTAQLAHDDPSDGDVISFRRRVRLRSWRPRRMRERLLALPLA